MIDALLQLIAGGFPLTSLVLEGPCGHHNALHRARQNNWHLIAKLRCSAVLPLHRLLCRARSTSQVGLSGH